MHRFFKLMAAFFCDGFAVVCATSKKIQTKKAAQVDALWGLVNVMCIQLSHTRHHIILGGGRNPSVVTSAAAPSKAATLNLLKEFSPIHVACGLCRVSGRAGYQQLNTYLFRSLV